MRRALILTLLAASCGSDPPTVRQLTLASTYDLSAVRRDFSDGVSVTAQHAVALTLEDVLDSGGNARAVLVGSGAPIDLMGSFDPADGRLRFDPTTGEVWSNRFDVVDGVGGTAVDGGPTDGLANEIVGFVQTSSGTGQYEASYLAVARVADRPDPIVEANTTLEVRALGEVRIVGSAGAAPGSAGVEVFRHQLLEREPEFTLHQARDDGTFVIDVVAFEGDLLLLRTRLTGRASTAVAFVVP